MSTKDAPVFDSKGELKRTQALLLDAERTLIATRALRRKIEQTPGNDIFAGAVKKIGSLPPFQGDLPEDF